MLVRFQGLVEVKVIWQRGTYHKSLFRKTGSRVEIFLIGAFTEPYYVIAFAVAEGVGYFPSARVVRHGYRVFQYIVIDNVS